MIAAEIEEKIAELKEARYGAVADSLDNPASEALAISIGTEIQKLEASLELSRLREKALAERAEAERQATAEKEAADRRQQADKISRGMKASADRADLALAELMAALGEIQGGARQIIRLEPERQMSLMRILDGSKIGRAVLGRRLADGSLVSDHLGTPRPPGPRPDQTIKQFVESFT